ncbi:malectin domain-containing carbohydrate-binding protein [Pricia sp. S334]|uniref:Malectin domain-containing carbohydrate-binding protein n=1 Tax=Pricia mediterranea TaxID=3076079 RepID=A0ABU3L263_9FLAO|nr:malectin domain-containing carbohydrate-binding protein [Pricia sp. S334]MDT7827289.1 malectin domain-containing carbohydrate-binding protein [Pricia sp. S334]
MRKITFLPYFLLFSALGLAQTPCSPVSPLDCAEVEVSLPVNFEFNSGSPNSILDGSGVGTGFTTVLEHSEARRTAEGDLAVSNPALNGYEPSLLNVTGGLLQLQSQAGIAFRKPGGSSNNNNQVNTLGIGLSDLGESIVIKTTLENIVTGGQSAQAGIWYGYDEDNFVKLNVNDNNVELRVESQGLSGNGSTGSDQVQLDLGASGNDVQLEMIIDPATLTAEAFYTIGNGTRTLLGSLPIPASYFTGRDISATGGQDNMSFAGIFASHRNGSQFTASFDGFSVEKVVAPVIPEITAPFHLNVAGNDYTKDSDLFLTDTEVYLEAQQPTTISSTSYTPYTVPGGHQDLYYPRRYGPEFSYNFPIANGDYIVALHMVENYQTTANARIFDVSIENTQIIDDIDLFATYGKGALALLSFDVAVTDNELNIDFLASVDNGIVQAIEILPVPLSDETDVLSFGLNDQTAGATIDSGAHTVAIEVANGTDLTSLAPVITLSDGATASPASEEATDFSNGTVTYTVTAEDGTTAQDWAVSVTEALPVNTAPIVENQNFAIAEDAAPNTGVGTVAATDNDADDLTFAITAGNDDGHFALASATGEITNTATLDFETVPQYVLTVEVSDGTLTDTAQVTIDITDVVETLPFEAHVNFQNSAVSPPSGYVADFGKGFGTSTLDIGSDSYSYGWKKRSDGTAIDVSEEAANNSNGAGRNRIGTAYSGATDQEKLEGTLIHFQGDNIISATGGNLSWAGQPRGNELLWELEIPNGTYAVTIGLGDKDANNIDSRHSATVEGYTIIPAFVPNPGQTVVETMVVVVSDGLLTIDGQGGFNSKITHLDVIESTATPVDGQLAFDPAEITETLETGSTGSFSSTLSGAGATEIGLVIDDNINITDKNLTGTNDWLTLPAAAAIGQVDFTINSNELAVGELRSNTIVATAKGFRPAELAADLTAAAPPAVEITTPYRMNVAGGEVTKAGDTYFAEELSYLVERDGVSETSTSTYDPNPGNTDLYFPRRFNPDFGYAFPIPNGDYTVAVHMVENYFTDPLERIFDLSLEGDIVMDDLDLVASYGKGVLHIATYNVEVSDNVLNIDFKASVNNGIVQAIEILPATSEPDNDLVITEIMFDPTVVNDASGEWFEIYNPGTEVVDIEGWTIADNDSDAHVINNGGPLQVAAMGYLILGNNSDTGSNGGTIVDYQYTGILLANSPDEIILIDDATNEIDRVEYDGGTTFPNPQGASIALNDPLNDNNDGSNWTTATTAFGTGDLGTPGVSNSEKANESPVITSLNVLEVDENQFVVIDVETTDDSDSEGSGINYAFGDGLDDALFAIDTQTGIVTFLTEPDFESPADDGADNVYNIQVVVTDSGNLTAIQDLAVTVTDVVETTNFEAHINFQDNPASTTPPAGYLADYGKQFGFSAVTSDGSDYDFGWKLLETGLAFDASEEAPDNSSGVGRMRLGTIANYNSAAPQQKLEGTLVHFQGDNIAGWNDGQPRKNELFWELEIPDGIYEVTIGLGDRLADNIDSRHSATIEGYTIISAFSPTSTEVRTASMVVEVTDGLLTMNGLGGFNSKITHIDVVKSTETPVNGILTFTPASVSETMEAGITGNFSSELSGDGATGIGLVIDDNIDETAGNEWLALPIKTDLGQFDFAIDATALVADYTRNNVIIATAKGFEPAILAADLTVTAGAPSTFAFIEDFDAYGTGNLHDIAPQQWLKEKTGDAAIPVLAEGLTPNTTHSLDFSNGGHAHDLIPLTNNPVDLESGQPFYFATYFKVASAGDRVRTAIRIDDDAAGDQWVREQVANDGSGGLIARIGLGNAGSDNGVVAIDSDEVFQFVVRGEWDGANTINYSWTTEPKLVLEETLWTNAGTHTVQGTPKIGRLFISSANTNDARLGPVRLATDYSAVVTEEIDNSLEIIPCNPLSTLPCDELETTLPVSLDFTAANGNISESGMTMVLEPSVRLASDDAIADANVPGYAPSLIAQSAAGLSLTSTKGIFYSQLPAQGTPSSSDTNSQMNALGTGVSAPSSTFNVSSTLQNPDFSVSNGTNSQQAGIWYGLDEDHIVKLVVVKTGNTTRKVQLQVEDMDQTTSATAYPELNTGNIGSDTGDISLRLELDPVSLTAKGYYALGGGTEILVNEGGSDGLSVPASYFSGISYDTSNPAETLNFAGIFTTHRRAEVDQPIAVVFKDFEIAAEQQPLVLAFDTQTLNFNGTVGETIAPQTVTVSASSGNPTFKLSDDPDATQWLILPVGTITLPDNTLAFPLGDIEFGIQEGLPAGSYSTTIFATDEPDSGYANGELSISLEIIEPTNDFAVNVNFSDPATAAPSGYEKDAGDSYGNRGNGYTYGWLDANTSAPADLTKNGRNRTVGGVSDLNNTLIHMQYGEVSTNANNGYLPDAKWELEVPNGSYSVTVFVGDPDVDGSPEDTPTHRINAEGVNLVDNYVPTGSVGTSTRFTSGSATVNVTDGRLTLDPLNGGFNTKINSVRIVATTGTVQTPSVAGITPADGATDVAVNASISANDLFLPNFDADGNAGVDNTTITNATVRLFKQGNSTPIGASVNGTGGGDAINLVPDLPLETNTTYIFEIDGVLDLVGEPFEFFTSSFTTGSGNTGPTTDLDNVSFTSLGAVATGSKYSSLVIGPDNKLYGLVISGDIHRWTINADGTLANKETLSAWKTGYGSRTSVGMVFDPAATAGNLIAYVSHDSGGLNGAPDWDGKISRLTGANLENEELLVTDLPRSTKDHLTNSLTFRPGEPNMLYFNQGSNSAAGKPDGSWGNREESLLTAATLRLDLSKLPSTLPLNVHTTRNATAINNVDVNSPTLDGEYNPYYVNAPLTLFATGIRNAYDLVWHSNGQLYVPTNGTAGGSNAPASIDGTRRPDGTLYDHSNPLYPEVSASNGNNVQRDWLFRIDPNSSLGYYGHPNPYRGEFVLNRGDADVNNSVYNGVQADENYRGAAFDFEFNKSPNGVIEYRSNAENGNLKGALLVVRYSGGSDIIALVPDGPNGDIATFKEGIPGFSGFGDPLDLIEDVSNGNIYVSDYGRSEIVLLKPSNQAAPTPVIVLNTDDITGDAVVNATFTKEILLSNLGNATLADINVQLTGADADQFTVNGVPGSINSQNSGSFEVLFTPTSNGPKFAQLIVSGTDAETVTIPLSGLGKTGSGGSNEPSLQWILDTQLGAGVVNVGDTDPTTNLIDLSNGNSYNDILGDEVSVQKFERAIDAPVTLELLSVYGPTAIDPVTAFGWYLSGDASSTIELFTVTNNPASNGQTLNAPITGVTEFDPGTESFGFYSRWPFFDDRQLFSEDALNTFSGAIPHHVRVYELPGEDNAYIIATEEHVSGFDYQDIVVIARNIRPFDESPLVACSPISILECDELEVALPFNLSFDGSEGGLSNTGFTMVDNPSARITADGPVTNPNVPGYEPSKLSFSNDNLIINANNGIAYRTNGLGAGNSSDVNSQINTLGVGIDADTYGSFSIETSIVNPYTDGSNNSEQAGIWFGLDEDNFVKYVANVSGELELRKEVNGISENDATDQLSLPVTGLNNSTVGLRLFVDVAANAMTAFYTLDNGAEVEMGSMPLPSSYVVGNTAYDNLSFAGIFASKRREMTADVNYTFEDFSITSDNVIAFDPIKINFSLPGDVPPAGYLTDSGLGFGNRGNDYNYGWLATDGTTALDLSDRARNREVSGVDILQNTLVHMQFQNVNPEGQEGIWEIEVPNGSYNVSVGVGDPDVDGQAGTEPFHSINVEGVTAIDRYSPTGDEGAATRFTSGTATATVTDGRLTIDASGGFNTKINSLTITQGATGGQPFFANVNPADNATNVAINEFQITVNVVVPEDYELDKSTLEGNVNLYEVVNGNEVLVPSNSNDTGGGDAITLTPLSELKEFTEYRFRLTSAIEANRIGDLGDRLNFADFVSDFTTGDRGTLTPLDLTGVEFTKIQGGATLGEGTVNQRFSSLVVGPDGKLYASTIGNFASDGQIYRWDMATDGTLENLEILSPQLQGAPHPVNGARNNGDRLIIGFAFDPAATADNLIAYVTHSFASETNGPEWDGVLTRLSGPDLSVVEDLIIHLPRSSKDHLTNSIAFDPQGVMYINQGSNSAGGQPDGSWAFRPERLLSAAVLKLELDKLPATLPLSAFTTDDIGVINSASTASLTMSDGTYNPYATNAPLTLFSTGVRNAYDLVWHSNGWLYVPTNGTAGGSNTPATADYDLARRIDGLTTVPSSPATNGNETQKDWLFKTQGGSYHGHPNPFRGEFILNHGGAPYSGVPGQQETSHVDVAKYPDNLGPDPNYREPAYDFEFNKSPNGVIEYQSDAFGGKLQGLLMVVRFSGQDDLLVMQPEANGNIGNVNGDVPGLGGFDDPLDVVEDPVTGNIYVSEYDRNGNGTPRLTLLRATVPATTGPAIAATPEELIFEMTVNNDGDNTDTKTVEVTNDGNEVLNISNVSITGDSAAQFEPVQPAGALVINPDESQVFTVTYTPALDNTNLGYQEAALTIASDDPENPSFSIGLHALKKAGFEGGEEPALQDVVDALGIGIDVGWTGLTNGTNPNPVGDESEVELWVKATDAPINVTPVGRYSPGETLPFGWYTNDNGIVVTNEVGILADGIENAQTLFPPIASGDASFDPQGAVFGFYVESNTFNRLSYTEDAINATQTGGVTHRTRIYPMADRDGNPIENSYLIAFEDASNGDYQDYMFVIDNVIPFESGLLALDFDKENLDFIASINQENVPVQLTTLSGNGGITAQEIDLQASEPWVMLSDNFELGTSFEIGVDVSGLSIGSYQADITASAPNYNDAVLNLSLEVTNELVYTYQFNFQDSDNSENSPEGYIDDIGAPYGEQSTLLGDLTYGWVLPGTLTPADASVNGRNRDSGAQDGVLLKTFTIIGHPTPASFPQRDWVVNVPNGTYSVNISVGERDYSNSNHILDVNGVTVLSFDQENNNPDNLVYFGNTKRVEVTDGLLRLSLNPQGYNAKPNYIRLAPIDSSLLPPTIAATFGGNESAPDTYRGPVDIALEATDNSGSGGIATLEYALDGNTALTYDQPIPVSGIGQHTLVVTAEDNNGNTTERTFNFTIEAATGALLAIENMTKVPGTDRGFPADDYYTFHRLGTPGQALVHDANVMRLNNTGTGELIITDAIVSDANDYTYEVMDATGSAATLPITIAAGSFADLDITFIGTTGNGNNGIFVEDIQIVSNADNALANTAVLHGAYSPQPEGGDEINAQEVFDAFGFQSSMLSIVNDEGTITPPNNISYRPSSNYPNPDNIDAGYEGDLILSDNFVQADPSKPVIGIQLSALHGGPGSNGAKFVAVDGTNIVGGMSFSHDSGYYQTLLPKKGAEINFDTTSSINGPFRIAVANYLSSGGNNINGNRPDLLGLRIYKVIDHNGNIIPNEYIVLQDFVQGGCGAGSANCDWNDNTFYFINIRPEGVPTAQPADAYLANVEEALELDIAQYFDKGYPGNSLSITATVANGALPNWLNFDPTNGTLSGTPPVGTTGSVEVDFDAVDPNGLMASTTLTININEAPIAVDDEVTTTQNVAILLDQLLANDSEPNGQNILITTVDTPLNGTAELQTDGLSVLYTPDTGYVGSDSFTYTIEDETGLSASANVFISVTPENQAPTALIVTSINEGPAALFVTFTGSGSTDENPGTLVYEWDFGDGSGTSMDADTDYTFTSAGIYTVSLKVTDDEGLFDVETTTITVSTPPNTAPTAVASASPNSGNPLQFGFDGSGSSDSEGTVSYQWNFGDGNTSSEESPNHTYAMAGTYDVSLTVTDEGDLTDSTTLQVVAEEPATGGFALRINAGGPDVVHEGQNYMADQNFVGGKVYANTSAQVPVLYQTERSSVPKAFAYNIPVENGTYQITLHFAEIYWGATGGSSGGTGKRIFDVTIEDATVLDDYDINADVGPQTAVQKTFEVIVSDGILNLEFDATSSDGVDQPKLSAIAVIGIEDPVAECELPQEWTNSDIGAVAANGDTCYEAGRFEVSASGADIWNNADEFHFVYQELEGDGEIIAQVLSLDPTSVWAKAGVMMRNDMDANSASTMMIIAPNPQSLGAPGYSFQHRPTKGATMGGANFTAPALVPGGFPHYVRMVRSGNTFTGYVSETNGNWTEVGSTSVAMNETIFVGLATTSHNDGTLTNAVYDNVSVTEAIAQNQAPTALIGANPLNGIAPLEVVFDSSGSDDDTGIVSYDWDFADGTPMVSGAEVSHTFTTSGTFEVTLTVADAEGETDTDTVTITVDEPNQGPIASFSATPMNGQAPLLVAFDSSSSSDDNAIVSYSWDFDDGNVSIEMSPSHTFTMAGTYDVTLTVTDAEGLTDVTTQQIIAEEPVTPDFALRINAGGPEVVHNGETFEADQHFVGGKSYVNTSAALPELYQTERSALPPNFDYEIPLSNGNYKVTLHFAELFWGANGGSSGGVGKRIFDVVMESNTILDDYDIIADVGTETVVTKTFDVVIQDGTLNLAFDAAGSDGKNEPKLSAIEIVSEGVINAVPTAVASANPLTGEAPLEVDFSSNGSDDDMDIVSYMWDFKDGNTSTDQNPQHTFATPGNYDVSLTVADAEGATDETTLTIMVEEPVVNDFALRINAGGPQASYNGETFVADTNFASGKSYENANANVPDLYQTERSASPPTFAYNVPVDNGNYQVVLHFAEIYWGATGGGSGGTGQRIFDVSLEGNTILDDYDINADVGSESVAIKTFNVTVSDGVLNLDFDAAGSDGVDQPKVSAIEILGVGSMQLDPVVDAGADVEVILPTNGFVLSGSGSDPDGGTISYQWTQVDGPDTALMTNANTYELTAEVLVEGDYTFRLTVTDDEGATAFDEVTVTATTGDFESVWLEAECADVGPGWNTIDDGSSSGGQYVMPPSGFNSSSSAIGNAIVTFNFSVSAGTYKIFGRVRTPSGTEDSFWVRVNGGPWVRWNSIPASNAFAWHRIHLNEQLSQPRSFEFIDGVNQIEIGHRESGAALDKLFITQTDDIPTALGGTSTNCDGPQQTFDLNEVTDNSGNANKTVPEDFNAPVPNEVSMFPNSAKYETQITMSNPEADITKLYVYDVSGRLLRSYEGLELKTSPGAYLLQVSNLENGVYLLRMVASDGNVFDEKLLVRR